MIRKNLETPQYWNCASITNCVGAISLLEKEKNMRYYSKNWGLKDMSLIHFNIPPFLGTEFTYMREAVENHKICGDGTFT